VPAPHRGEGWKRGKGSSSVSLPPIKDTTKESFMADRYVEIIEKRSEPRHISDKYYSVEFKTTGLYLVHQFKIWDMSSKGMCILVKKDSDLLNTLKVGKVLNMKYYSTDSSEPPENLKTEIRHITKHDEGRFQGHYSVGISILEKK
jgi:hypothetical protein